MTEEPEDYNAFDKWDAVGAAAMLGVFPAALQFFFGEHDVAATVPWLAVPVLAAVAVYLCSFLVSGKSLGRIVNLIACILTPIYAIITVMMWSDEIEEDFPTVETEEVQSS